MLVFSPKASSSVSQPGCEDNFPHVSNPHCKLNQLSNFTFLDSLRTNEKNCPPSSCTKHACWETLRCSHSYIHKNFCFYVTEFQPRSVLHSCPKFSLQIFCLLCQDCLEECVHRQSIEKGADPNRENAQKEPGQT